jgi:hypothetical protein
MQGQLVLRWLEGYMAFSKANRAQSSIWSPEVQMELSVYGLFFNMINIANIIMYYYN